MPRMNRLREWGNGIVRPLVEPYPGFAPDRLTCASITMRGRTECNYVA
jgi:hypothetical protein